MTISAASCPAIRSQPALGRLELVTVAGVLVLAMLDLPNYLNVLSPGLQPKLVYFPMLVASIAVLLASSALTLSRVRPLLLLFVAVYSLANIGHALLFSTDSGGEGAHIAWSRLQFLVLAFGIALSTTAVRRIDLARIFAVCSALIAASLLVDYALPDTLYPLSTPGLVPGRFGSFFINPNKAGEAVVLTALLGLPALSRRTALPLLALAAMAVLVTFSRSAMLAMALLTGLFWANNLLGRTQLLLAGAALLVLVAGGGIVELVGSSAGYLPSINAEDIYQRLQFLTTGDLHDDSVDERTFVLVKGLELFAGNLLLGAGAGATHLWEFAVAPHNQAVMMASEYGMLGLAGWLVMLLLASTGSYFAGRAQQLGAAAFILFFSMSTHNMLDFPYWIIALMVMSMRYAAGPRPAGVVSAARPAARQAGSRTRTA